MDPIRTNIDLTKEIIDLTHDPTDLACEVMHLTNDEPIVTNDLTKINVTIGKDSSDNPVSVPLVIAVDIGTA